MIMFIIKFIFTLFLIFVILMVSLGLSLWLKVKTHLKNPFTEPGISPMAQGDNVIEGEYKVLEEDKNP